MSPSVGSLACVFFLQIFEVCSNDRLYVHETRNTTTTTTTNNDKNNKNDDDNNICNKNNIKCNDFACILYLYVCVFFICLQVVPIGAPYFVVEFDNAERLLHRVSLKMPLQFGR